MCAHLKVKCSGRESHREISLSQERLGLSQEQHSLAGKSLDSIAQTSDVVPHVYSKHFILKSGTVELREIVIESVLIKLSVLL